jgi:poly(hydroxyalkanoate) granule-associated protein
MPEKATQPVAEEVKKGEEVTTEKGNPFVEATRKVLLASVGAVALAQDEAEDFVNKLIERGQIAEKDGRKMLRDLMERKKPKAETVEAAEAGAEEVETGEETEGSIFLKVPRNVLWAGFGALAMTQDGIENAVNKLVERGEIAEKDARKLMDELKDRRKKRTQEIEAELDEHLEETLTRMNIPTKDDIDDLSVKIAELSKKVEELKASS